MQLLHQTVKAGRVLQKRVHLLSSLLNRAGLDLRYFFSSIAPSVAFPSALSVPSVTKSSKDAIFCFSLFVRSAFTCMSRGGGRHKKAVNSALLTAVPQVQHPRYRTSHTWVPSPRHDPAAQLAIHTHSTCPKLLTKEPSVATWFRKPSIGMPQFLYFSDSHV